MDGLWNSLQERDNSLLSSIRSPNTQIAGQAFNELERMLQALCSAHRQDDWRIGLLLNYLKRDWARLRAFAGDVDFMIWATRTTGLGKSTIYRLTRLVDDYFNSPHFQPIVQEVGGPDEFMARVSPSKAAIVATNFVERAPTETDVRQVAELLADPTITAYDIAQELQQVSTIRLVLDNDQIVNQATGEVWFTIHSAPDWAVQRVLDILGVLRPHPR